MLHSLWYLIIFTQFVSVPRLQINIEPSLRSIPLQIQAFFEVLICKIVINLVHFLFGLLAWSLIATTTTCPGFIPGIIFTH